MALEICRVTDKLQLQFVDYCLKYGPEHDGSYLPGRDVEFSEELPSYAALKGGELIGAVSLMRTERFLAAGKARFSILHCRTGEPDLYARLLDVIRPHTLDLRSVFLFMPERAARMAGILEGLGFSVERYSFILEREGPALPAPVFPAGIYVAPLAPDDREGIGQFADCINEEFKSLAGHTPSSAEFIQTFFDDRGYIPGGVCLLKEQGRPIGTIAMMYDLDDMSAGEIMALGILEDYRGRDLGRNLLRYGFNFLFDKGLEPVFLAVNGENRGAIRLYEGEGFQITDSVVCYSKVPG